MLKKPGTPSPKRTGGAKFTGILSEYSGRKAHENRSSTTGRLTTSNLGNLPRELLGPQLTLPLATKDFAPLVEKNAKNNEYPYDRRVCQNCDEKIETQDAQGKCSSCGTPFRYAPLLRPGQSLGTIRIIGTLAFGGFGCVYLGVDTFTTPPMPVVLKGMITADPVALESQKAEMAVLFFLEHENLVRLYRIERFGQDSYMVLSFVDGKSLEDLREATQEKKLPTRLAIHYILQVLKGLGYLHGKGYLHNDIKSPNIVITPEGTPKILDLGAVSQIHGDNTPRFGSAGFMDPNLVQNKYSVQSDLYSLAMVALEMITGLDATVYNGALPDCPELQLESLQLFFLKALQPEPAERFGSAAEMEEQLLQILYEVAAIEEGRPSPIPSKLFGADPIASRDLDLFSPVALSFDQLPEFRRSNNARWWSQIEQAIAAPDPIVALSQLVSHSRNDERDAQYALIIARARKGEFDKAGKILAGIFKADPFDPKLYMTWMQVAVLQGDLNTARQHARQLWFDLPGEIAPRLVLAAVHEALGQKPDWERAASLYLNILKRDPAYVSAAFGLNRACLALGKPLEALDALDYVPVESRLYMKSLVTQLLQISGVIHERSVYEQLLTRIDTLLGKLANLDEKSRTRVVISLHESALKQLDSGFPEDSARKLAGVSLTRVEIQKALRDNYRALGRMEAERSTRIMLVEEGLKRAPFQLLRF